MRISFAIKISLSDPAELLVREDLFLQARIEYGHSENGRLGDNEAKIGD